MQLADQAMASPSAGPFNCIRQLLCIPPLASTLVHNGFQEFHVLLETSRGRLVRFSVKQRAAPDMLFLQTVARRAEFPAVMPGPVELSGDLYCRDDIDVTVLDGDITDESHWCIGRWAQRALLDAVIDGRFAAMLGGDARGDLIREHTDWFRERLAQFLSGLDAELMGVLQPLGALRPSHYNYLLGDGKELRRNRVQALRIFPILQHRILEEGFAGLREVIDRGLPLIDALASRYDVPRAAIRAVRGVAPLAACAPVDRIEIMLALLRDIPPSWWPRSASDWGRFAEAGRRIAALSRQPPTSTANRLILHDCARNGYRFTERGTEEWQHVARQIDDFLSGLRDAVRFRLCGTRPDHECDLLASRMYVRMLTALGIERVGGIAERWGDAYRRAQAAFAPESEIWSGARWPSLSEIPVPASEFEAHPLLTAKALADEGDAMTNCVASFASHCMDGTCQIWSLRSRDGAHVATLEVRVSRGPDGFPAIHIGQCAGPGNSEPSKAVRNAAGDLVLRLLAMPGAAANYLLWQRTVASRPMSVRVAMAFAHPIITALDEVLPERWALERLEADALAHAKRLS